MNLKRGDVIWNNKIKYPEYHLNNEELNKIRNISDDIADNVLIELNNVNNRQTTSNEIDSFLFDIINNNLSEDIKNNKSINIFINQISEQPTWLNKDLLSHARLVFLRYHPSASLGLLYFSLIGGFSIPKITKVLDSTGYLTTNNDNTWKRLLETLDMIVNCIESDDSLEFGKSGWLSILKVRFLHTKVRLRLLNNNWDCNTYGLPINQGDLMATLLAFSINIIYVIQTIGAPISEYDIISYLHLWRYIGYLIGIREEYNPCDSYEKSVGRIESIVYHLFHPTEDSINIANHVLLAVSNRPPNYWSFDCHSQMARCLLDSEVSNALKIKFSLSSYIYISIVLFLIKVYSYTIAPFLTKDSHIIINTKKILRHHVDSNLEILNNKIK